MATIDVSLRVDAEAIRIVPSNISVVAGDVIRFTFSKNDAGIPTLSLTGFSTAYLTSGAGLNFTSVGQTSSKTVKAAPTFNTYSVTASASGLANKTLSIKVSSGVDNTPNDFNFTSVTGANPSEFVESETIILTGFNTTPLVTPNNGGFIIHNGDGVLRTSATVSQGSTIALVKQASASYSTAASTTISVGTLSKTFTVTTAVSPNSGQIINFPRTTAPVELSEVIDFYAGTDSVNLTRPTNLRSYLKGGTYVPNITKNASIASSGNLSLASFIGSGTSFYFSKLPQSRSASVSTIGSARTLSLNWNFLTNNSWDMKLGFGPNAVATSQIRWVLSETPANPDTNLVTGVTLQPFFGTAGNAGNYQTGAYGMTIQASSGANTEARYRGTLTVYARPLADTSKVVSAVINYSFWFYGP